MAKYGKIWQNMAKYGNVRQNILATAMNGGFWQYAAVQFYLHPMHTNQLLAGTIKLCFDTIAKSCTTRIVSISCCSKLHAFARNTFAHLHICKENLHICRRLFQLMHLIIKHVTGYKCNGN